ncbi:MAG: hypothetical protein H7Y05_11330 [Steroidobacteraceae bacterium]|nr:hypothetical protein [Deltaproteobacteria bacterium]
MAKPNYSFEKRKKEMEKNKKKDEKKQRKLERSDDDVVVPEGTEETETATEEP